MNKIDMLKFAGSLADRIRREAHLMYAHGTDQGSAIGGALERLASIIEEEAEEAFGEGEPVLVWGDGPMGFPATTDWRYWVPCTDGYFRAWFFPTGLPVQGEQLLADKLATEDEAKQVCEKHARGEL